MIPTLDNLYKKVREFVRRKNVYPTKLYLGYKDWMILQNEICEGKLGYLINLNDNREYKIMGMTIRFVNKEKYFGVK